MMMLGFTIAKSATLSSSPSTIVRVRDSWLSSAPGMPPPAAMRWKCNDTPEGASAIISASTVGLPGGTRNPSLALQPIMASPPADSRLGYTPFGPPPSRPHCGPDARAPLRADGGGAPLAVLPAEELFVSGCQFLISMTSAGQIVPQASPPYFVVIDRALRDEGTSYHYLPPAEFAAADPALVAAAMRALRQVGLPVYQGAAWTTDAPFRETAAAIERARAGNILAVEMEAAPLYAFAHARHKPVLCLAHVTNQMAVSAGDFEKGEADGAHASLNVIVAVAG